MHETESQSMIRDAVERLVREATADGIGAGRDMDEATWSAAVDSGLAALVVPEDAGGLGLGAREVCIVAEELGRGLLAGSYVWTSIVPAVIIGAASDARWRGALLEDIAAGGGTLALADAEPDWGGLMDTIATRATECEGGYILEGRKSLVHVDEATRTLLLTATLSGRTEIFALPVDAAGLEIRTFDTVDAGTAGAVSLGKVMATADMRVILQEDAQSVRRQAWDLGLLAIAAECVGIMKALIGMTADYLQQRKQFGRPLSHFQTLRHRMADMALARMGAEALVTLVATQLDALSPAERSRLVPAACSKALGSARFVAEQAVHLHGGMGVTEEVPVGRYLRRVLALAAICGSASYFRVRAGRGSS